jgi:hypothetical protein
MPHLIPSRSRLLPVLPFLLGALLPTPEPVGAQAASAQGPPAPQAGLPDPIHSLGQPSPWAGSAGLSVGLGRMNGELRPGALGSLGVQRSLLNPITGVLGLSAHGYAGYRGGELDGGARVFVDSHALYLHLGADWNAPSGRVAPVVATTFPPRRGGFFRRGGLVRIELVGGREPSLSGGVWLPLGRPHSGRTRPVRVVARLPEPGEASGSPDHPSPVRPALNARTLDLLEELDLSIRWIGALHNLYWQTERTGVRRDDRVLRTRQILQFLRAELAEREALMPERAGYTREVEYYHRTLERTFTSILGGPGADQEGVRLGAAARQVALDEVILPYNATVGRWREPDTLDGLARWAESRFAVRIGEVGLDPEAGARALEVFRAWLGSLERERDNLRGWTGDGRMQWIPLAFVLREEDHDSREKVDALVERALGRPFTEGNRTELMGAVQFQEEFRRTLRETRQYHLLWIHDIRGRDALGRPDRTAFGQVTEGYLRALLESVRALDETGRIPAYIILLDQHFYEERTGRLWMDLLERPLTHGTRLPSGFRDMEEEVAALQDSLRAAVAGSRRLRELEAARGRQAVEALVKVHVNITNPADHSFRTHRLLGVPLGSDNLLRDHRKLLIRDVTPLDPHAGEVILTGVGIGDHYATATWDDRSLRIRGPAALEARDEARRVLEENGVSPDRMPLPLRPMPAAPTLWEPLRTGDPVRDGARVIQVHNRTGWGPKDATFLQMLLWDLLPPGTVIYVPDSLWTSPEWMAQLVSAALRGCRVLIVAPAFPNAPVPAFPTMSETRELLVALLLVREVLGDMIREAGGDLQVGVYARQAAVNDVSGQVAELDAAFRAHPFLHGIFPLGPEAWEVLDRHRIDAREAAQAPTLMARDSEERRPKLHQKSQFFASADLLEAVGRSPALPGVLDRWLERERLAGTGEWRADGEAPDGGKDGSGETPEFVRTMLGALSDLPESLLREEPLYLMVGSLNKNVRSMALDGEVMGAVSGAWALEGYLDFLRLTGSVAWLETPEELDQHIAPYSDLKRLLGRFFFRVL